MKKLILICTLLIGLISYAQDGFSVNVYQDIKLAIQNDDYGNTAPTLDIILKGEKQFLQRDFGYIVIYPQIELADLAGGMYTRYSGGLGVTLNNITNNLDVTPSFNAGFINRWGDNYFSTEFELETSMEVIKNFRIAIMGTYTQRSELYLWRYSSFIGLKYLF